MKIELRYGKYVLLDQVSWAQEKEGELWEVFRDGKLLVDESLKGIRGRMKW